MARKDPPWAKYSERELEITRESAPDFEQWSSLMHAMNQMQQSSGFWRGDLYLQGELWYGEEQATSIFDPQAWDIKTWQNCASVCRRIPPASRRRELSYSHHAVVAYLDEEERDHYLDTAVENNLSVRGLRDLIRFDTGKDVSFQTRPLLKFLEGEADKIERRMEDAEGDVRELMQTAVDSLRDAHEVQADFESEALEEAA